VLSRQSLARRPGAGHHHQLDAALATAMRRPVDLRRLVTLGAAPGAIEHVDRKLTRCRRPYLSPCACSSTRSWPQQCADHDRAYRHQVSGSAPACHARGSAGRDRAGHHQLDVVLSRRSPARRPGAGHHHQLGAVLAAAMRRPVDLRRLVTAAAAPAAIELAIAMRRLVDLHRLATPAAAPAAIEPATTSLAWCWPPRCADHDGVHRHQVSGSAPPGPARRSAGRDRACHHQLGLVLSRQSLARRRGTGHHHQLDAVLATAMRRPVDLRRLVTPAAAPAAIELATAMRRPRSSPSAPGQRICTARARAAIAGT
jgi:hypothetical protein